MADEAVVSGAEAPRGIYPARVDEKGRLKLPVAFQQYLQSVGPKVFVTSLDQVTARIYPTAIWAQNESLFDEAHDDPESVEDLAFLANVNGCDSELDAQGRVLIHTELRRSLGIENQPVYLDCLKGRINVYSVAVYEERRQRAQANAAERLKALERRGLR